MSEYNTKRREIRNYRDLFDNTSLGILVRDVLEEQCEDIAIEYSLCLNINKLCKKYGVSWSTIRGAIIDGSAL